MDRRHGQYLHHEGWKGQKRFSADGTSTRTFTVLVASAYDAGIIGPEHNGITVIDEDNQSIVLDQHFRESTGYFGPSPRQQSEYKRVMQMGWTEFSEFCRSNRRFRRGSAPDIESGRSPDYVEEDGLREAIRTGKATEDGKDIRTDEMKALDVTSDEVGGLTFPCRTREQMIVYLANHTQHSPDRYGGAFAWNIKVYNFDTSGKVGPEQTDSSFDERWNEYLKENEDSLFWQFCEEAVSQFIETYAPYPGGEEGLYKFGTTGRSNGWLYLRSWDGPQPSRGHNPMTFNDHHHLVEYLRELTPEDLCRLYKLVANVDHDVRNPKEEIEHRFNYCRSQMEQEWAAEKAPTP